MRHNVFHVPDATSFCDAAAAIIVLDDGRYLMQLRDDTPGIFYPDHWGLFGGALEPGESPEVALRRELREELDYAPKSLTYLTSIEFDFECLGAGRRARVFYEVRMTVDGLTGLRLSEGRSMEPLDIADILLNKRVVPYDSFAIWMHYARPHRVP